MKEKETIIEINDSEILTASLVRFCLLIFSSFIRFERSYKHSCAISIRFESFEI